MSQATILSTLQRLVSGLEESIVIFDQTGTVLHASEQLKKLLEKNDLVGTSIFDFLEGRSENVRLWLGNLSNSHFKDVRIRMVRKSGIFPARLRMAAWSVEGGFIVVASIVDGTFIERRKRDLLRKTLTIEHLSKSRKIREGKLYDAIYEIVNVNGGAIALGHPLGCTGAKLTVQLIDELRKRNERYGIVTMCVGTGQGAAGVIERLR